MCEDSPSQEASIPIQEDYQTAKEQLNQQTQTFRAFAEEGQRMLRIILVLGGVVLTAVSVSPQAAQTTIGSSQCAVNFASFHCPTIRGIMVFSFITLVLSAILHMLGNEAKIIDTTLTPADIENNIVDEREYSNELYSDRLEKYKERIERNDRTISSFETNLAWGKILLGLSIIGFSTTAISSVIGPIPIRYALPFGLFLAVFSIYNLKTTPNEHLKREFGLDR